MILVDTHIVVWLALDQTHLSKNARAAIDDARQDGDGLAISDITLLELATLLSKGRIRLDISLESFLGEVEARFIILPISGRACVRALGLPATYPKDPADRIIGATALVEGLSLLTADRAIRRSRALHTIWREKPRKQMLLLMIISA
jgi:PIN domain nuclease of toxin-antitoxin system